MTDDEATARLRTARLRTAFEKLVAVRLADKRRVWGLRRSHTGTYQNPGISRDWRWFQLGAQATQQDADGLLTIAYMAGFAAAREQRDAARRKLADIGVACRTLANGNTAQREMRSQLSVLADDVLAFLKEQET